jgi:hypothetical protein
MSIEIYLNGFLEEKIVLGIPRRRRGKWVHDSDKNKGSVGSWEIVSDNDENGI